MYSIRNLLVLWDQFQQIPIDSNRKIKRPFLRHQVGTPESEVLEWFEKQNSNFVVHRLHNGLIVHVVGFASESTVGFDWYHREEDANRMFESKNKEIAFFKHEKYTAYRFDAIVSDLDHDISLKEIDESLTQLFKTADAINGPNELYAK